MDEFARIERLRALFGKLPRQGVEVDIGDDAAVLAAPSQGRSIVVSVDASVEDVHFTRHFASYDVIAERAFVAALSDLAAMGAAPRAALSALALPHDVGDDDFDLLVAGLARAAESYACPVIGGNLSQASELSITTTVLGEVERGKALTRSGARDGDAIYVTGILGAAGLGFALLESGNKDTRGDVFIARWRKPSARIEQGQALLGVASAAIDVSDGLLQDLGHLCRASGLGAVIEAPHLPLARGFAELAHAVGRDPTALALAGGEDYELVYTVPSGVTPPAFGTKIGRIDKRQPGIDVRDGAGRSITPNVQGYRHFA